MRRSVHGSFAIDRDFDAPVRGVFAAWIDLAMKGRWFIGPPGSWTLVERALDVRVGGHEVLEGRHADGTFSRFTARYHAVVPDRRLVFVYNTHRDGEHCSTSLVTVELSSKGPKKTHLSLNEQAVFFDGEDGSESLRRSAGAHLGRLAEELADPRDIVSTRFFAKPREQLFESFRDGGRLACWWGPKGFSNTFEVFEPRAGGRWRFIMRGPDGATYPMALDFIEVRPTERIAYRNEQAGHAFTMHITFVDAGGGTLLVWRMRFDDVDEAQRVRSFVENANEENFDRLTAHLGEP